jgi:hypothetical protein
MVRLSCPTVLERGGRKRLVPRGSGGKLGVGILGLCLLLAGCGGSGASANTQGPGTTPTPSPNPPPPTTSPAGPVKILGWVPPTGNSPCGLPTDRQCFTDYVQYVLPNLNGLSLQAKWANLESSNGSGSGGYDFSSIDDEVSRFMTNPNWSADKKIVIVLSPVGHHEVGNDSTPVYVFTKGWADSLQAAPLDVCTCENYPGDGRQALDTCANAGSNAALDPSGMPAVFELPFRTALRAFYKAAIAHFNSVSYRSSIAYIRAGISAGGEAFPWCSPELETLRAANGQLKTAWLGYAKEMYTYEAGLDAKYPIMAATNGGQNSLVDVSWSDDEAADAIAQHLVLGSQGLQESDISAFAAGQGCSNDFCRIFSLYHNQSSILEIQTDNPTNPSGQGTTGSLVNLLPFAVARFATYIEVFPQDLLTAFDPNYNPSGGYGYNSDHSSYSQAIASAQKGAGSKP